MIVIQRFNRAGWPPDSTISLEEGTAAAILTAVRDYEAEKHISLHGDYLATPVGGDRTLDQVKEMRAGFVLHQNGSAGWQPIYQHYGMDTASKAIPSLTSQHLTGHCADISNNGFLAWLKSPDPKRPGHNIAARYGLVFTLLKENDLRHAQYFPGTQTVALDVNPLSNTTPKDSDMTHATLYHQVNIKDTNQAYLAQMLFSIQPIGEDWAKAICKSQGIDFGAIPTINEFDFNAINGVLQADLQAYLQARAAGGTGSTPADYVSDGDLAAALTKLETDIIAAIPKGVPLNSEQTAAAVKAAFAGNTITLK